MNMTKVYRAELRDLKRNKKAVERDYAAHIAAHNKLHKRWQREHLLASRACVKAKTRINKRIAILEGRLS